jgi:hypothetical protein
MRLGIQAKSDATRHRPGQGFRFVEGNFRRCICLFLSFISPLFYLFTYSYSPRTVATYDGSRFSSGTPTNMLTPF